MDSLEGFEFLVSRLEAITTNHLGVGSETAAEICKKQARAAHIGVTMAV